MSEFSIFPKVDIMKEGFKKTWDRFFDKAMKNLEKSVASTPASTSPGKALENTLSKKK